MEIILASTNLHKIREFKEMFKILSHIELISLRQFEYTQPEEIGQSLKENAILKAVHAAQHLDCLALADDTGLIVPALKGEPGIHSRRYAGPEATDMENRQKLLEEMKNLSGEGRAAYCECWLALASPQGLIKCFEGVCQGSISPEPRGRNGFGYDPLFIKQDYEKTFAELDEGVKNRISHRHKAFERLATFLESLSP